MLLSFDDRTGKSWRFHYSYWNSSQRFDDWTGKSRKEQRLRRKEKLPAMEHTLQGRSSYEKLTTLLRASTWSNDEGEDRCTWTGGVFVIIVVRAACKSAGTVYSRALTASTCMVHGRREGILTVRLYGRKLFCDYLAQVKIPCRS
ncbi:uncharacterized protein LOC122010590 [Zingiber officinale]|uniref:uncharacterized protein LOC122010590 n=1 Tax=Zingiber officinale TaxID=94328 RepID=UPI001C4A8AA5|nr:uncharacterized protein LOC122010590 [Zingiber officinale]